MSENITAAIHYTVGQTLDDYDQASSLEIVLTTLRKHGVSPKYFEYEPERDEPKGISIGIEADAKPVEKDTKWAEREVLAEQRETKYDSRDDETTVILRQRIKGSI